MNEKEALIVIASRDKHPPELVKEAANVIVMARRQRDPLWNFKPTPTQEAFLASKTRYKLLSSANRGGKTTSIAVKLARCAMRKDPVWSVPPNVNGIYCVFAPRRDQIVDPWFKKLCEGSELKGGPWENEPMIPKREIKKVYYTHGGGKPMPKVIELNNGNRIWFGVSGDKHAWEGLEGKGMVLGVALDESAGTQSLIDECMVRLLDAHSHPDVKKACGGGWLDWGATETKLNDAFTTFRAKCEDDSFDDYAAFWIKPDENPSIDPAEREKYRQVLSEDAFRARMEGEGGAQEALAVYPQFDDGIHWCNEPYTFGEDDTIFVGYDPGSQMTGLTFVAYKKNDPRHAHVFAARELRRATIQAEAQCIKRTVMGRRIEWLAYDQAARKVEKSSGSTVLYQLMSEMKRIGMAPKSGYFKGRSNYRDSVPVVRLLLKEKRVTFYAGSEILRSQFKTHRFTERSGELKEDNIQAGNDHCFVAGTQVFTEHGNRPIETLQAGDKVWTRHGLRCITNTMETPAQNVGIIHGTNWLLEGTGNHPVWRDDKFIRLDAFRYGDNVLACQSAVFAAPSFQRTDTCQLKLVAEPVVACFVPTGIKTVYNISVDGEPEYFANGVLVHNCVDSFRYLISTAPYWKDRGINRPTIKDDGLEISFSQDDTTMTDEQFNIRQQMNVSALYAAGKLPGWEPLAS